jgi:hypothetical protein
MLQEPYHIYLQRESKTFQPAYRVDGYCYLYLINPWYHGEYQWPPQPTMAQLSRIPKEMRDNWSTRVYRVDHGIYHLEPDSNTRYWNPWKLIEEMGQDPEKMGHILRMDEELPPDFPDGGGIDDFDDNPPPAPPIINMADLLNAIVQLQANINNLHQQNQGLQDQIAAMEAAGPPAAPPPWAPPGIAPEPMHGIGAPAPVVNLDAAAIGAAITHALPPPAAQTTWGPMAKEPEPFDGKMENVKTFIRSCQIYIEIKHAQFATEQVSIMWALLYMTKGSTNAWRENILDQFEDDFLPDPFTTLRELFNRITADFGDLNERTTKVMVLKKICQGTKTCEEHIQEFKQVAWGSGYTGSLLINEFK